MKKRKTKEQITLEKAQKENKKEESKGQYIENGTGIRIRRLYEKPQEKINNCICGYKDELKLKYRKYSYKDIVGILWYYKCPQCGEQFTTTESDTLSQKTWKTKLK